MSDDIQSDKYYKCLDCFWTTLGADGQTDEVIKSWVDYHQQVQLHRVVGYTIMKGEQQ